MRKILYCSILLLSCVCVSAQNIFSIIHPDKQLSPLTGMTRQHWKDAALYLLKGAFTHVHGTDDAMQFPKQAGKSYPRIPEQVATEKLEGLCRTMFIAGPLLKEDTALQIGTIKVGDYYRHQIALLLDSTSNSFIKDRAPNGGPSQILVEFGGLALSLMLAPDVFWDPLPAATKKALATKMLSYGEGPTIAMNWRFFNINILSFFKSRGYAVNESYLPELLDKTLAQYRGDGWYNDSPYFDYYSMWAFQMYGAFWSEYFGKQYYPGYAEKFLKNLHELADHYPYMFGRDGNMIMWGRSIAYRMGAAIPLPLLAYTKDQTINYGWMRRIASSTILQFLQNPDFLDDGVPTLGFYGAFEPAVQTYSCRGSAYWLGKLFLALYTPAYSPFWKAVENEGPWKNELKKDKVYNQLQENTDVLITDYPGIGAAEVRATTSSKTIGVYQGTENYNRLSYNSAFPWQADGAHGEVAMNYVWKKNSDTAWEAGRMFSFMGYKNDIYYRKLVMTTDTNTSLQLAEITFPNGILRIDKCNSSDTVWLRLGHYALAELDRPIKVTSRTIEGHEVVVIDNGRYQLAMVNISGWKTLESIACEGLHPESKNSVVINAAAVCRPDNKAQSYYVTIMLWKRSGEAFSRKELAPLKKIIYGDKEVRVEFRSGGEQVVGF